MAAGAPGRSLHGFGEMVNCLCSDGLPDAAIELEWLWNSLMSQHDMNMLCAYRRGLLDNAQGGTFDRVCRCHREILPMHDLDMLIEDVRRSAWPDRSRAVLRRGEDIERAASGDFDERLQSMSNELRTPLHAIRLQLQAALRTLVLDDVPDIEALRVRLRRADDQAVKLARLLDQILTGRSSDN